METNEEKGSQLSGLAQQPSEWLDYDRIDKLRAALLADDDARIPVHRGTQVVGYVRVEDGGRLCWEPGPPELPAAAPSAIREALGQLVRHEWMAWAREQHPELQKRSWLIPWEQLSEAEREVDRRIGERLFNAGRTHERTCAEATAELPTPPFGGHSAYERIFEALRSVDYCDPTRLELAAATVHVAVFGARAGAAEELLTRIELPWPRDPEQFEELLMRIPLWSIVAHLVRDRDTEAQCREYQAMMFLPDDQLPPLLDHLDRTLRDGRELWRVCVEQEKALAGIREALDGADPVAAIRAVLEAGRG